MTSERKFIEENVKRVLLKEFLKQKTERSGFGGLDIQRTPMGTRVTLIAERPGMVIGRKGETIKELTEVVENQFKFDNPQIEVKEVSNPNLNPHIMAQKLANALERGWHFRRAGHSTVRRIMNAGAKGCQVIISGKLTGQRHRTEKFREGHIKYCGETRLKWMLEGYAVAKKKLGIIGVKVQIMDPNAKLPDEISFHELKDVAEVKIEPTEIKVEPEKKIETEEKIEDKPSTEVAEPEAKISEESIAQEPEKDAKMEPEKEKKGKTEIKSQKSQKKKSEKESKGKKAEILEEASTEESTEESTESSKEETTEVPAENEEQEDSPEAELSSDPDKEPELESEHEHESEPGSEPGTESEPGSEPGTGSEGETKTDPEPVPKEETKNEPNSKDAQETKSDNSSQDVDTKMDKEETDKE